MDEALAEFLIERRHQTRPEPKDVERQRQGGGEAVGASTTATNNRRFKFWAHAWKVVMKRI